MFIFDTHKERFFAMIAVIIGMSVMLAAVAVWNVATVERGVPVVVSSTWFQPDIAKRGDVVTLFVDRNKTRDCPLTVNDIWIDRSGVQIGGRVRAGGGVGISDEIVEIAIELPMFLVPGKQWGYLPKLYYKCDDQTYPVPQLPAWVMVTE